MKQKKPLNQNASQSPETTADNVRSRKLKYSSIAWAFVVLFVAGLVLVNALATVLTDRLYLKGDLTQQKLYEVSFETQDFLKSLTRNVEIIVLATEAEMDSVKYGPYGNAYNLTFVREALSKYEIISNGRVTVRYVDPDLNGPLVQKYSDEATPLGRFSIVVDSGTRFRTLYITQLYEFLAYDPGGVGYDTNVRTTGLQIEQQMVSAMTAVTSESLPRAVFTQGHNEPAMNSFSKLLVNANYNVQNVNLTLENIPDDTKVLVINDPQMDFTLEEITKLENYLAGSGYVYVLMNASTREMPVLDRYLSEWGVQVDRKMIFDDTYEVAYAVMPEIFNTKLTVGLETAQQRPVMFGPPPVVSLWLDNKNGPRELMPLFITSQAAYAKPMSADEVLEDFTRQPGDQAGPFIVGTLTEQTRTDSSGNPYTSGVFVLPATFLSDEPNNVLANDNLLNRNLATRFIRYAAPDNIVVILPRSYDLDSYMLNMPTGTALIIFWALVIALPLGLLVMGFLVWRRRRRL